MKTTKCIMAGFLVFSLLWLFGGRATAQSELTTTLLPTKTKSGLQLNMLRIATDKDCKSVHTVSLEFDLSAIPPGAVIKKATLRLVAPPEGKGETFRSVQIVKLFKSGGKKPVATLTSKEETCCAFSSASTSSLLSTVRLALKEKVKLSLTLLSESRLSDWQYYSMAEYGGTSSNKPRLIIEYKPPQALIDREQELDTTRTRWKYFPQPNNVTVKPFLTGVGKIISNPVFYDGGIYLFAQPSSQKTRLYALYPGGGNRWGPKEIKIRPGSHALVTSAGRLYSVGEDRIVIYDLENDGAEIKRANLGDFKPALRPTLGADGSLYAMPSGSGYIYGFNLDPQELWRCRSDDTKLADASRITLSPDAGRYAYVLTKVGKETHPVRIDTATGDAKSYSLKVTTKSNGEQTDENLDLGFKGFHRPVAIEGPEHDYVFLSAYTEQNGMLLAHSGDNVIWWQEGPVSQPLVDWGEKRVIAVQSGKFCSYKKFNGEKNCASSETDIAATSNLVKDGEDNVYFCNNGFLLGYTKDCKKILRQKLDKLPKDLELMFAPDGTLYARTGANALYSITPSQKILKLVQKQLNTDTIYGAEIIQVAANLQVRSENVILKAEKSISFGKGFSVKKGASVRCRIGF